MRLGGRISKESEPQFQLDLVPWRRGLVPERRAGDAPWQFAPGVDERCDCGGVFGGGDLFWTAGEAALGARERETAAGVKGFH